MDPTFELFYMPPHLPFVFYGQLLSHVQFLKNQHFQHNEEQMLLAKKLKELHNENYRPDNLPDYNFSELKKGGYCPNCFSYKYTSSRNNRFCTACGYKEKTAVTIKRSIDEFRILSQKRN